MSAPTAAPVIFPRLAQLVLCRRNPTLLARAARGRVLHLVDAGSCHDSCSLTPSGRFRRGPVPACGQRVRGLRVVELPALRLCAWCAAIAGRDLSPDDWRLLDASDVIWALQLSRAATDVDDVARALHESPGLRQRRVHTSTGRRIPLIAAVHRSRAWTASDLRGRHAA